MTGKLRGKGRRYGKKCGVTQGNSQLTVTKDKVCECVTNQKVKVAEAKGDLRNVMSEWKPRHGAKSYTIKHYAVPPPASYTSALAWMSLTQA